MKPNQTQHTPGPWQLYHLPFSDSDNGIDLKGNNGNTLIANFPTPCPVEGVAYRPGEEDAANLLLIASAPDLLAALEIMLNSFVSHFPYGNEVTTARAAIARAKGETNP